MLVMIDEIIKKILREATTTQSKGSYTSSLSFGYKDFDKHLTAPFTEFVNNFDDALLDYDALDGKMSYSREFIKKREKRAERQSKAIKNNPDKVSQDNDGGLLNGGSKNNTDAKPLKNFNPKKVTQIKLKENLFSQNDGDGNPLNGFIPMGNTTSGTPGHKKDLYKEATESTWTSGEYNVPLEHGLRDWKRPSLAPFDIEVEHIHTHHAKKNKMDDLIVHHLKSITEEKMNEDLGVWFGTKKKPKGSSQPKGPWVNICRKKEGGGHPPCGRPEASDKGYPKCRAAGVASKMTDSQKKSACQQKRNAEKSHPKSGTGNKPKMTHYEPKNESLRDLIKQILKENLG